MKELLMIYYRSKWGWNVVDYFEYPSHILIDEQTVSVDKVDYGTITYF